MKRLLVAWMLLVLLASDAQAAPQTGQQDQHYLQAFEAARQHQTKAYHQARAAYGKGPLVPYLDFAWLYYNLDKQTPAHIDRFLARQHALPVARLLRQRWLTHLGSQRRWSDFLRFWQDSDDERLRCYHLRARKARGSIDDADLQPALEALWLTPHSLPKACDPLLSLLRKRGWLNQNLIWQRFEHSLQAGQIQLARWLISQLGPRQPLARDWLRLRGNLHRLARKARHWPDSEIHRRILLHELQRHAVSRPAETRALLQGPLQRFRFTAAQKQALLARTALFAATDFLPQARTWLEQSLARTEDAQLRRWAVRLAMVDDDWWAVLKHWQALPATDQQDSQWLYWKAHALARTHQDEPARHLFMYLSRKSTYYGFLAADRLSKPYNLCLQTSGLDVRQMQQLLDLPALQRALALKRVQQNHYARLELAALQPTLDDQRKHQLALILSEEGWHAAAIRLLGSHPRLYTHRFPLAYLTPVRQAARQEQLPPEWLLAIIRAESAYDPQARSRVGARGLMQIMPQVGSQLAHKRGLRGWNPAMLEQPELNIRFGAHHLNQYLHRLGHPVAGIAAYNAGPDKVAQWLKQPASADTLLWMETLPYAETRAYLRKVLAYQVIYQWHLHKRAARISTWLAPLNRPFPRSLLLQPGTIPFWCQSELPMPQTGDAAP